MHKMAVKYVQLKPGSEPPKVKDFDPFRSVVVIEEDILPEWQHQVSSWLVASGCLYMMAWGKNCGSWDDSVDFANLEVFDYKEIPRDKSVMTTWHENVPLKEVYQFAKQFAFHPTVALYNTLLLHVSDVNKESKYLAEYETA